MAKFIKNKIINVVKFINNGIILILLLFIKFYKKFISPLLGNHCRFYPSCSEYAILALQKHGLIKGLYMFIIRILKCNPFSSGGIDYP